MEDALVKEAAANSQTLFGERLSEEQLLESYKSITQKTGDFPRNVRAKVNLGAGPYATRYWDMGRAAVPAPGLYAGKNYNAVLSIRSLWVSNDAWGLVCDATDLQIVESPPVDCPFADTPEPEPPANHTKQFCDLMRQRSEIESLPKSHPRR